MYNKKRLSIDFDPKHDSVQGTAASPFYVEFDLMMTDEKGKKFSLTNSVRLKNTIK